MKKINVVPYVQKVEQHITKNETAHKTENKVKNLQRTKVVQYIQKVEAHTTKTELASTTQPEVKNITQK